jgi:hypothetical protein
MNIRRILAATDFSEGARAAVERAARREPGQGCAVRRHGRTGTIGKTTRPVLAVERWPEDACRRVLVPVDFVMCW